MFRSKGLPLDNILWHKSISTECGKPIFYSDAWKISYANQWCIFFNDMIVAYAQSFGQSPCTIFKGEWLFMNGDSMNWEVNNELCFVLESNTKENPYDLFDIGEDFFTRVRLHKPIWFIDPSTKKIENSGAKTGKRYCWICGTCFSGNNFVYQHSKVHSKKRYRDENYQDFLDAMFSENL